MTAPDSEDLMVLISILEGIRDGLDSDDAEGRDPAFLSVLLDEALSLATAAELAGVSHLLRICSAAVTERKRISAHYSAEECARLSIWFGQLAAYSGPETPPTADALMDGLQSLPNLPPIPGRLRQFLIERLLECRVQVDTLDQVLIAAGRVPASLIPEADAACFAPVATADSGSAGATVAESPFRDAAEPAPVASAETELWENAETASIDSIVQHQIAADGASDRVALVAAVPGSNAGGDIWISPEELELATDAVLQQLLPGIDAWEQAADESQRELALADFEFHLGLIASALQMLGLAQLSAALESMQLAASSGELPESGDVRVIVDGLAAFLTEPDGDSAELLAALWSILPFAKDEWTHEFLAEAARVRVGLDPAIIANRKTRALPEDVALEIAEDVLPNVRAGMLRELPQNSERLGRSIRLLVSSGDSAPIDEARRVAHTLKGDANTVGVRGLANLTHVLEDLLLELHKHPEKLSPELGHDLDRAADCIEEMADYLLGRGPSPGNSLQIYQTILDWENAFFIGAVGTPETAAAAVPSETTPDANLARTALHETVPVAIHAVDGERTQSLTVSASLLDELQRLAGEALVVASQLEQRIGVLEELHREQRRELGQSAQLLIKLDDLVTLRGAALQSASLRGDTVIDPLELDQYSELHVVSRQLIESGADQSEHQRQLESIFSDLDTLRSQQGAVHADLQREVQRARTVPFDQISGRLQRIVRQTARQIDREAELTLRGTTTLIDAELLDRIVEPLGHVLRNAVDHGLEDSAARLRAGKSPVGSIAIDVRTVADMVEIHVVDDGRGLDYSAIRAKAIALGMIDSESLLSEPELAQLILTPGFTTRSQATQVSGRGIGMDVVNQRVRDLRGSLLLESVAGQGLSVRVRLPVSQTVANVLVVEGHNIVLGALVASVERVHGYTSSEVTVAADGQTQLQLDDEILPLTPVEALYGLPSLRPNRGDSELGLIVRDARGRRQVIGVTAVGDVLQVVVKPISRHLPTIPAVRGMTLLGDGSLATVVDLEQLVNVHQMDSRERPHLLRAIEAEELPRVVVADDSLSVRRALTELMEDAGFEVAAARDGLEALELINRTAPSLVLMDLEMPKLNGLEVTRFMRSKPEQREIPVVMITSRASDKYRAQALEAGVTLMLGKPFSEDELVRVVRSLARSGAHSSAEEMA